MDDKKRYFFYMRSSENLEGKRNALVALFSKYGKVTKMYLSENENKVYFATLEEAREVYLSVSKDVPIDNMIYKVVWPNCFGNISPDGTQNNDNSEMNNSSDMGSEDNSISGDFVVRNYVDVFGAPILVREGEDCEFYVPLKELQKRGMFIVPKEEYRSKIVAHKELVEEYEKYVRAKAMEFLIMHQCEKEIERGVTDQIINRSKSLVFKRNDDSSSDEKTPLRKPNNFGNKKMPSPNTRPSKSTKLNVDEIYEVNVTFIMNESSVFVNLADDTVAKFLLEVNMCAEKSSPVTLQSLKEGNIYAALFDGIWCRVLLLNKERLFFEYIDFGNRTNCKLSELRQIPEELTSKPFQAISIKAEDSTKGLEENETYFMKPIKETPFGYKGVFKKDKKDFDNAKPVPKKKVQLNSSLNSTSETESDEVEKLPLLRSSTKKTHRDVLPTRENTAEPKPMGVSEVALNGKKTISKPIRKTVVQFNQSGKDAKEKPEEKTNKNLARLKESMLKNAAKEETVNDSSDTWGERTTIRVKPNNVKNVEKNERPCAIERMDTEGIILPTNVIDEYSFLAYIVSPALKDVQDPLYELHIDVTKETSLSDANVGDVVVVQHNDEGEEIWARAVITEVRPHDFKYNCALIDFGETIFSSEVYACPRNILDICELSFVCTSDKAIAKKMCSISDESLMYAIKKPGECTITIKGTEYTFKVKKWNPFSSEMMKKTEVVQKVYKCVPPSYALTNGDILRIVKEKDGFLYVVTKTCVNTMKEIKQEIQQMKGEVLNAPEIDQVVLSPKPNEDNLHRAIIKKITGDKATVDLIDYAEIGTVPLKVLRNINEKLSKTHCGIIKAPKLTGYVNKPFTPKSLKYIEECVNDGKKFKVRFCANNEIDLISADDGTSLNEKLSNLDQPLMTYDKALFHCPKTGHVKLMCLNTDDLRKGTLVFCTTDGYFSTAIRKTEEIIKRYVAKNTEPYEATVKEICLARYEDEWYRAVVTEKNNDEYTVFYLDYGNSSMVTSKQIKKFPPELNTVPCFALYCLLSLEGLQLTPKGIPDHQFKQLNELLNEMQTYEVKIVPKTHPDNFLINYTVEIPSISKKLEYEYDGLF